jgi:putative Mn2+ efflux pump MntP
MPWPSAALIAMVSNLDNASVGAALGMRGRRVPIGPNALIAGITMAGTAGAMTSGRVIARLLPSGLANGLGAAIVIAIGIGTLITALGALRRSADPRTRPVRQSASGTRTAVSWGEAIALGVALSLNNIGSGIGAGIAGVSPLLTTVLAGAFSLVVVGGGSRVGRSLGRLLVSGRDSVVAGAILVALGVAMLTGVA